MKKYFNKKLVMTKEDDEYFENSINCWICDKIYVSGDVKVSFVRDHCYISQKYRGSAHRCCNINVKLNHKTHMNRIPQPIGLEKYMSFNINIKLIFSDSSQFLSSSLSSLVKNLGKDDFKYLSYLGMKSLILMC